MALQNLDAIVIGTGQAGKPLAGELAEAGWKTAIVEKEARVGGSCVLTGCTPTKTMVASARVAHLARRAAEYGVRTGPVSVDLARVRERKRAIVDSFSGGSRKGLERQQGLELVFGEARFVAPHEVKVRLAGGGERHLAADHIFINTGTRAALPELAGIESVPHLDHASIMELDAVPEHLLVIGGGYIGLEFGQMFARFGSRVSIVQRATHLLPREDEDVSEAVETILREEGLDILLESRPSRASAAGRKITVEVAVAGESRTLSGSHLLIAAGRTPNTDTLDIAAAGLEADARGFIPVDERLQSAVEGIYVLGDAKGGPAFTHISYDDYRIVADNLLRKQDRSTTGRLVPYTVFIDPELGRVGITEREAKERRLEHAVAKLPMTHVARALEVDETRGFMKAIVERRTEQILGAAILGIQGGEIMSVLQVAMMGKLRYTALRDAALAHPTVAESLNNLFSALE